MNKAFVRDPDDTDIRCPLCGAAGQSVPESALAIYLPAEVRQRLGSTVYFCETPTCDAVYFDVVEDFAKVDELLRPCYPKDPAAPLCACFGLTADDIEQDLAEGTPRRVREIVAMAKTPAAQCSHQAASGRSCVGEVQKYYLRRWSKSSGQGQ
jgi:hypothetical protein